MTSGVRDAFERAFGEFLACVAIAECDFGQNSGRIYF